MKQMNKFQQLVDLPNTQEGQLVWSNKMAAEMVMKNVG